MAAIDDSLTKFEGKNWLFFAEKMELNSPIGEPDDDDNNKQHKESTTTRFKRDEMAIYGYCPRYDDFYLVICDMCGQALKPQALKKHIETRHADIASSVKMRSKVSDLSSGRILRLKKNSANSSPVLDNSYTRYKSESVESTSSSSHSSSVPLEKTTSDNSYVNFGNSYSSSTLVTSGGIYNTRVGLTDLSEYGGLVSPSSTHNNQINMEVKSEEHTDSGGLDHVLTPPPTQATPPELQHILPHPSPHTGPSPNVGPPGMNLHNVGPPGIGPPNVSCQNLHSVGMAIFSSGNVSSGTSLGSSDEESINRISAMLQQEAEAITASQNLMTAQAVDIANNGTNSSSSLPHDIVEAQGLARGCVTSAESINSQNAQGLGSVSFEEIPADILNQIQENLLVNMSESDLNALLNATPNTSQTYIADSNVNRQQYAQHMYVANQYLEQQHIQNEQMSVPVDQINSSIINDTQTIQNTSNLSRQYSNSKLDAFQTAINNNNNNHNVSDKEQKTYDELTTAVNSITQLCNQGRSNSLDTQLVNVIQPSSSPVTVSNTLLNQQHTLVSSAANPGISVVIGSGSQKQNVVAVSSQVPHYINKKGELIAHLTSSVQTAGPSVSPSVSTVSSAPRAVTPIQNVHITTASDTIAVAPLTPSPKKCSKNKRKPSERKFLPLKDREYDPDVHCGVIMDSGKSCTRSLTCKTHSLSMRRSVLGRSKKFDELLIEHRAAKEAQQKASRPPEAASSLIQDKQIQQRCPSSLSNTGSTNGNLSHAKRELPVGSVNTISLNSPLFLVKTFGSSQSYGSVTPGTSSPSSHISSLDPSPSTPNVQTTPPSPANWSSSGSLRGNAPSHLYHTEYFYVRDTPKPLATCSYNARRLGGYLATNHKQDFIRSALKNALKKPLTSSFLSDLNLSNISVNGATEKYSSVKPLLARKLQSSVPVSSFNKDSSLSSCNSGGPVQINRPITNATLTAPVKRAQFDSLTSNSQNMSSTVSCAKTKNKRVKQSDGPMLTINSVIQAVDSVSGNKNHIPVLAVSLQNGLTSQPAIAFSNVAIAGVRKTTGSQPIRINTPLQPSSLRDGQIIDSRSSDSANILLGSSLPTGNIVITENHSKALKTDASGSIRLELHGNSLRDSSRLINSAKGISTNASGACLVGAAPNQASSCSTLQQNNVTYLTSAVPGGSSTSHITLHQVINPFSLQTKGGRINFLRPNHGTVAASGPAFVVQHEKEPS